MSKIYEALEREARKKRSGENDFHSIEEPRNFDIAKRAEIRSPALQESQPGIDEEFINLYYAVDQSLGRKAGKVVQFIGSSEGDGTSSVVERFGRISTAELGKSVLLLKADNNKRSAQIAIGDESQSHVLERLGNGASVEDVFSKNEEPCFFVLSITNLAAKEIVRLPQRFQEVLEKLRDHFDLILVDMPAPSSSLLGIALCAVADGVILIVEAEKTSRSAAMKAKQRIERAGGNILGVVLNKHQDHLPHALQF